MIAVRIIGGGVVVGSRWKGDGRWVRVRGETHGRRAIGGRNVGRLKIRERGDWVASRGVLMGEVDERWRGGWNRTAVTSFGP